jgi:hypothetical protein
VVQEIPTHFDFYPAKVNQPKTLTRQMPKQIFHHMVVSFYPQTTLSQAALA